MITSNIDSVINRLTEMRASMGPSIKAAMNPALYEDDLLRLAKETLTGLKTDQGELLTDDDEGIVAALLGTFAIVPRTQGFEASMGGLSADELGQKMSEHVSGVPWLDRDKVLEWVKKYKDLDGRDISADGQIRYEQIANQVIFAMVNKKQDWFTEAALSDPANPEHLVNFLGIGAIAASRLSFALRSVLARWKGFLRAKAPRNVLFEIRMGMWKEA